MHRLLLNADLPDSHKFRTRTGVCQEYAQSAWTTDPEIGPVYARWMTCGKSVASLPPVDLTDLTTFLYDKTIGTAIAVPDTVELDVTLIDDLYLEPMTCIATVSKATGILVEIPIQYTSTYTILDVSALSGVHRFFFVPKVSVTFAAEDLTDGKYTLFGTRQVHGVVKNDVCVFDDVVAIQYENNRTIIDFGVGYASGGDLLYSTGYIISTYVDATATYVKMPTEYPAAFVDPDNMFVQPTINLFNGFTSLQLGTLDPGIIRVIITEWVFHYLKKMYGDSFGFSGAKVPNVIPSTAVYDTRYKGYFATLVALESTYPTANAADWAMIGGAVNAPALWNSTSSSWVMVQTGEAPASTDILYSRAGTVVANRVYYYKNSAWTLGDPTDTMTQMCALWLALGTAAATDGMAANGIVDNVSWNWTTVDGPLYLDDNGLMTEVAPTIGANPGEVVRVVGYVMSATRIRFCGFLPGGILNSVS